MREATPAAPRSTIPAAPRPSIPAASRARRIGAALLAAAAVAACAGGPTPVPEGAAPFAARLAEGYDALAAKEIALNDWIDARRFRAKARSAAAGAPPALDDLSGRDLAPDARDELALARALAEAVLATTAPLLAPVAAADMATAFDCWAEEAEDGLHPEDRDACRARFFAALAEAEAAAASPIAVLLPPVEDGGATGAIVVAREGGAAPVTLDRPFAAVGAGAGAPAAPLALPAAEVEAALADALAAAPRPARSYLIYFETGAAAMTAESSAAFDAALADALADPAARVTVFGHTDTTGPQPANVRVARRRAEAIRAALVAAGLPEAIVAADSFGEAFPLVATGDGVAEPRNRRVEIVVR